MCVSLCSIPYTEHSSLCLINTFLKIDWVLPWTLPKTFKRSKGIISPILILLILSSKLIEFCQHIQMLVGVFPVEEGKILCNDLFMQLFPTLTQKCVKTEEQVKIIVWSPNDHIFISIVGNWSWYHKMSYLNSLSAYQRNTTFQMFKILQGQSISHLPHLMMCFVRRESASSGTGFS